jgi:transposase
LRAANTTLTQLFGVGPIVAATVLGHVGDISRFATRDHFAAYNGTAPIEVSSGNRKIFRLSLRGNRQLNHVIHMAAVVQIRSHHSPGGRTTNASSPKASPARKHSARSSDASASRSSTSSASTLTEHQHR